MNFVSHCIKTEKNKQTEKCKYVHRSLIIFYFKNFALCLSGCQFSYSYWLLSRFSLVDDFFFVIFVVILLNNLYVRCPFNNSYLTPRCVVTCDCLVLVLKSYRLCGINCLKWFVSLMIFSGPVWFQLEFSLVFCSFAIYDFKANVSVGLDDS